MTASTHGPGVPFTSAPASNKFAVKEILLVIGLLIASLLLALWSFGLFNFSADVGGETADAQDPNAAIGGVQPPVAAAQQQAWNGTPCQVDEGTVIQAPHVADINGNLLQVTEDWSVTSQLPEEDFEAFMNALVGPNGELCRNPVAVGNYTQLSESLRLHAESESDRETNEYISYLIDQFNQGNYAPWNSAVMNITRLLKMAQWNSCFTPEDDGDASYSLTDPRADRKLTDEGFYPIVTVNDGAACLRVWALPSANGDQILLKGTAIVALDGSLVGPEGVFGPVAVDFDIDGEEESASPAPRLEICEHTAGGGCVQDDVYEAPQNHLCTDGAGEFCEVPPTESLPPTSGDETQGQTFHPGKGGPDRTTLDVPDTSSGSSTTPPSGGSSTTPPSGGNTSVPGCMDPGATNHNPSATTDNGSCTYPPVSVPGCMDPGATNHNPSATTDNGSCTYPPPFSCPGGTVPAKPNPQDPSDCKPIQATPVPATTSVPEGGGNPFG